jgi:DNA-damage-inducible protein J
LTHKTIAIYNDSVTTASITKGEGVNVTNSVNLNIRVDAELKHRAESIFNELGMNLTTALNLFLRSAVRYGGIPLELRLGQDTGTAAKMQADILQKVAESEADVVAERTRDAYESLHEVREIHGI